MPSFDVVWTYDNGIVAALVGYKEMGAVDLDVAANAVMADDAKNCKGDFASGRKISEPAKLVSVKRLFTTCRSARQVGRDPLHPGQDQKRASDPARPSQPRRGDRQRRHCRQRLSASLGAEQLQVVIPRDCSGRYNRSLVMAGHDEVWLPALEQLLDVGKLQFHVGRAAVIALAREGRLLHVAEKRVHLLGIEPAAGAHAAVTGHG